MIEDASILAAELDELEVAVGFNYCIKRYK